MTKISQLPFNCEYNNNNEYLQRFYISFLLFVQMTIIHTVGVQDVFVHFEAPFMKEQKVEHPLGEDGEFMTRCSVGKLMTEKCIRGNGVQ